MGKHIGVLPHPAVMEIAGAGIVALQGQAAGEAALYLTQASVEALRAVYGEAAVAIWAYQIALSVKGELIATGMLDDGRIKEGLDIMVGTFPDGLLEELTGFAEPEEMVTTIIDFYETMPSNLHQMSTVVDHFERGGRLHNPHGPDDPDDYQGPADV